MKVAIFASGGGSNAAEIIKTLHNYINAEFAGIAVIISNNENAGVKNIALANEIPFETLLLKNKTEEELADIYFTTLDKYKIDFIVLAGYLKKLPSSITKNYSKRIINIHPALLPAYGGAGMYGKHVHEAVITAREKESGITIHYVDEVYDHGQIIFQAKCGIDENDTSATLASKVLALEHAYYTKVIAQTLLSQIDVK